jgi:hypothetical protein
VFRVGPPQNLGGNVGIPHPYMHAKIGTADPRQLHCDGVMRNGYIPVYAIGSGPAGASWVLGAPEVRAMSEGLQQPRGGSDHS